MAPPVFDAVYVVLVEEKLPSFEIGVVDVIKAIQEAVAA
jgi:hypothetical protein